MNQYKFTNYDYWIDCLEYWKNEKELAIIGSTYYSNCCARIGIIEDVLKCVEEIPKAKETLYTEEQVREVLSKILDSSKIWSFDEIIQSLKQSK